MNAEPRPYLFGYRDGEERPEGATEEERAAWRSLSGLLDQADLKFMASRD